MKFQRVLHALGGAAVLAIGGVAFQQLPREREIGSYCTSLNGRTISQRHNAYLSLLRLKGDIIPPGSLFSFNERVGSFSRDEGYRKAPVSYNGQLISDWGGGVCQTSTTLYNAVLLAGMKIIERHRHRFAPSYITPGRDAAVAFSNIDLRFVNPYDFPVRIEGDLVGDDLRLSIVASHDLPVRPQVVARIDQVSAPQEFDLGAQHGRARVRNTGKIGCHVTVLRFTGGREELISTDTYPPMARVVQYR